MNKDLTTGKPEKVLWQFCLPLFGSIIFQQLYNIADSFVAGKFISDNALAAVGNSYEITLIFIAFAFGCNIACSVLAALFFGAKQYNDLKTTVYTALISSCVICAALMLVGIGLLSLDGQAGGLNVGDLLTLACGFLFAAHIIAVEQCQKKTNTYALIVLQFAFCGLYAAVYSLIFERGIPMTFSLGSVGGLLYIAVFSTTIGMSLQNIGQSMAPASHAVILLSLESVFGVLFSCLLLGEKVTPQMGVGFAVIFAALLFSELAPKKDA